MHEMRCFEEREFVPKTHNNSREYRHWNPQREWNEQGEAGTTGDNTFR